MMPTYLAVIGAAALWLTFVWLAAAIVASAFSAQKGYGEKVGLVTGTFLSLVGAFVWAVWPARDVSRWNVHQGLTSANKALLAVVEVVLVAIGVYVVTTVDASSAGRIGLIAVVIMGLVIAAGLVKLLSISQETGGKTMAELRAERDQSSPA